MMLNTDRETSERMQERGKKKRPLEDNAVGMDKHPISDILQYKMEQNDKEEFKICWCH